jgi:hypothetical protein
LLRRTCLFDSHYGFDEVADAALGIVRVFLFHYFSGLFHFVYAVFLLESDEFFNRAAIVVFVYGCGARAAPVCFFLPVLVFQRGPSGGKLCRIVQG